ncbi:trypsin-like peptidase domain-containing protein [Flavobacterium sp. NKUCC04_CG]|uniref:trypsin-like peptidase domain-containing protein n=1 Tax=Flavobacterium sp. NKUCC04_CG TaxID=2842121 RepID=UPI001C5B5DA2|nr:trypsin-like peptidase domain-containing protein [Flavobacterium sp. NKUCC04_CG]MBW3520461.1 trypsin-like peptidase domain-containing protein [Flavobacterium sp. NKUCC04_CG]
MNKLSSLLVVSLLSGIITLGGYKFFIEQRADQSEISIATSAASKAGNQTENPIDFSAAAENTVHTVVHVKNLSYRTAPSNPIMEYFYGYQNSPAQPQIGIGSGVIISEDGYIVTNNHVIAGAVELEVTLNDNTSYPARLIGTDKSMDIALLKIDTPKKLPYITFGDSDEIKLGEWVLAVGNPYNLNSTVTAGIISAKARNLSKSGIQSFIQTDAVVNSGNSGGALVNTKGELIGINTMISSNTGSYVGYSFAVPSNVTRKIVQDLMEFGNVQQGVLGIQGFELTPALAKEKKLETNRGFYVESVNKESGAKKAGLQSGDIITQIDKKNILTFVDLNSVLNTKRPNDKISVTVKRQEKDMTLDVFLSKKEAINPEFNGFTFQDLSVDEKKRLKLPYGIRITSVSNERYAAYQDELEGAVLLTINGTKIESTQNAIEILNNSKIKKQFRMEIINRKGELIRLLL